MSVQWRQCLAHASGLRVCGWMGVLLQFGVYFNCRYFIVRSWACFTAKEESGLTSQPVQAALDATNAKVDALVVRCKALFEEHRTQVRVCGVRARACASVCLCACA